MTTDIMQLSPNERQALRKRLYDDARAAGEKAYELEAQAEAWNDELAADHVLRERWTVPYKVTKVVDGKPVVKTLNRRVSLLDVLIAKSGAWKGQVPETLSIGQARRLREMAGESSTEVPRSALDKHGRVPYPHSSLSTVAEDMGFESDDALIRHLRHLGGLNTKIQSAKRDALQADAEYKQLEKTINEIDAIPTAPDSLMEQPSLSELRTMETARSLRSRSVDEARRHSKVIAATSPLVSLWMLEPARWDVKGIDTPENTRVTYTAEQYDNRKRPRTSDKSSWPLTQRSRGRRIPK